MSERVKTKVIELLYSWSVALPDEAKITEAYQMLKKQGSFITNINTYIYKNLLTFCVPILLDCFVQSSMHSFLGIVTEDPEVPVDKTLVPSPKPKNPVFDNEEKSKVKEHITVLKLKEIIQIQYNLLSIDSICCICWLSEKKKKKVFPYFLYKKSKSYTV